MLSIHLDKELEEQIDLLAKVKQSNRSALVREAVIRYLEDEVGQAGAGRDERRQIVEGTEARPWPEDEGGRHGLMRSNGGRRGQTKGSGTI